MPTINPSALTRVTNSSPTHTDRSTIRERALKRPGMSVEKLDAILARQMPQAEKKRRADYIFETDRPLAETRAAVDALVKALRATPKDEA